VAGTYKRRQLSWIDTVVVHHAGVDGATVEAIRRYHKEVNGWPDIGYHYVVDTDGHVTKTNPLTAVSYHARGVNIRSVGICLLGNLEKHPPTEAQVRALGQLLDELERGLGRRLRIVGHGEVGQTTCPGRYGTAALKSLLAARAASA